MALILFVGHDAGRWGAQIELLHILRWLRANTSHQLALLLGGGGPLLQEYQALARVRVLPSQHEPRSWTQRLRRRVERRLQRPALERELLALLAGESCALVYANTSATLPWLPEIRRLVNRPVLCHFHELEVSIRKWGGLQAFEQAAPHVTAYVAASEAVARNLVENHAIARDRIHRVHEGIDTGAIPRKDPAESRRQRALLGIPEEAFVIGGCGTLDWRKGPDLFLQVANRVRKTASRPVQCVWVGGDHDSVEFFVLNYERQRFGLEGSVHFVAHAPEPWPYFSMFDAFLLSSREDPFPLVCLEAAAFGLPIVCFEGGGGMPEFVEQDAGFVVPYLDLDAAAERLSALSAAPELGQQLGQRASEKVKARCDMKVIGPQIASLLERYALPNERLVRAS